MTIRNAGGRSQLKINPDKIVWEKHTTGQYVGFRKTGAASGTWWARVRDAATGKQHYKLLGEFADHLPKDQWNAALKSALEWFRAADAGVTPHKMTVGDACERHVEAIRADGNEKKADETEGRFRRLVYGDPVAGIELGRLRKVDLEAWRRRVAAAPARVWRRKAGVELKARNRPGKAAEETRSRSASTVNRDVVPVRAALNRALDDGLVASDLAWRVALKPTEKAGRRRDLYLDKDERRRLVEAADDEIRPFLRGLAVLPLRPGALAALTAGDYDHRRKSLRIGVDKNDGERWITLPATVATFLREQTRNKLPAAPIFCRADGMAWNKDSWKGPIKDAASAAELPSTTTAYVLRHSTITDLVVGGLDLLTVAQISGTSVAMIEAHYGHLRQDHAAAALAALAL